MNEDSKKQSQRRTPSGGIVFSLLVLVGLVTGACAPDNDPEQVVDTWIRGGTVVDGTGGPTYAADVLIVDDAIVHVGSVDADHISAKLVIDATGKVVTPGFIDTHAHGSPPDGSVDNFLAQGVTTLVLGQDGRTAGASREALPTMDQWREASASEKSSGSPLTLVQWMTHFQEQGARLNVATLVGHGTLRHISGVGSSTEVTSEQFAAMRELLLYGLDAGAYGMSTGLEYVPGRNASRDELRELARIIGDRDGVMLSHLRSEEGSAEPGTEETTVLMMDALDELIEYGEFARVHASHIKLIFSKNGVSDGQAVLDMMRAAKAGGVDITADVYPYYAGVSNFYFLYPLWAREKVDFEDALINDKERLVQGIEDRVNFRGGPQTALILNGEYANKTVADVAGLLERPFAELIAEWGYSGPRTAHFTQDKDIQELFVLAPEVAISSDGSAEMHHPRSYGSNASIIEKYVETGKLDIAMAIYKMSGLPAAIMGINDRGTVAIGKKADLVVFDPAAVKAVASWTDPTAMATGFDYVLVNGKVAVENDVINAANNGRVLRKGVN